MGKLLFHRTPIAKPSTSAKLLGPIGNPRAGHSKQILNPHTSARTSFMGYKISFKNYTTHIRSRAKPIALPSTQTETQRSAPVYGIQSSHVMSRNRIIKKEERSSQLGASSRRCAVGLPLLVGRSIMADLLDGKHRTPEKRVEPKQKEKGIVQEGHRGAPART